MAKTVGDLLIKLGVDGIEGVNALKGSLRDLSKASKISDGDFSKLSNAIKGYSKVVGNSERSLRGQISALKGLREQAELGGSTYNKLTRDIERYEKRLKSVGSTAVGTAEKLSTVNQVLNAQIPARKPAAFGRQIAALRQELSGLSVTSDDYLKILRQIQERELAFGRAQERQSVIGRALTAGEGPVDKRTFFQLDKELPNTTRALNLRLSELRETLVDTNVASENYKTIQREIVDIEKQLTNATNQRIEAIKGVTDQQRRAEQLVERSRGRKQRLLGGQAAEAAEYDAALKAHKASPAMAVQQLSDLYKQIGQVSASRVAAQTQMMGRSYREVASDIQAAARAGNNNIATLQDQRAAFSSLRSVLDPTSRDFREVTKEVEKLDRRLERLQSSTGKKRGQLLQGAGAIASAGIFGGPLGALGATAGFIAGGPGGAVLGGGAGASAQALLDQARAVAEYTQRLNLSKQTLALASNGQEEYNVLLAKARSISKDYAVGLMETISGFSQIAVAARANNLTLKDTETIYRGLVASGIAFGKSQEDIDAIVTASVQVLSKGKLSAEELQGQIGERLPGAVAKFAEATGRSLPQLAADLKKGEVQISDFVTFAEEQFLDYDEVARLIGDSPEKAGARLKLALDEAVENFGGFFLRVGAGFQDLFTGIVNFVNDNKDAIQDMVVDFIIAAEKIKSVFGGLAEDISKTLGPVLSGIAKMFGKGVDAIYDAVMYDRDLRAGGFDPEQARKEARQYALSVVPFGDLNVLGMQRVESEAYQTSVQQALARGRKARIGTSGGPVDTSDERREEIKSRFKFKPFKYGDPNSASLSGTPDPDEPDAQAEKLRQRQKATFDQLFAQLNKQIALEKELDQFEKERIRIKADTAKMTVRINRDVAEGDRQALHDLSAIYETERLRNVDIKERDEILKNMMSMDFAGLFAQQQGKLEQFINTAKEKMNDWQSMAVSISQNVGNAVGNSLTSGLLGLVDGTKKAKEVFADFLRDIAQILAQESAKIIGTYVAIGLAKTFAGLAGGTKFGEAGNFETGTGLTGFAKPSGGDFTGLFTGRATGGPVESGQPYMVGERGPELFIPFQRGQVLSKQRTEEVAEAAFSSTSVTNNNFQQMQSTQLPFTKTAESASQESMRQPLNIRYESTVVNGVEYVTAEQHRKGMAQAAERGRDLSIEALQNSVRTRRKVAI